MLKVRNLIVVLGMCLCLLFAGMAAAAGVESNILGAWKWEYYAGPKGKISMKKQDRITVFKSGGIIEMPTPKGVMKGNYELKENILTLMFPGAPQDSFRIKFLSDSDLELEMINSNNEGSYGLRRQ